jgi:hypothetical protein
MIYALCAVAIALVVGFFRAHPVAALPRYKFNSIVPRILNTGAVTCLGWCFIRRHFITGHHRAHELYHHSEVCRLGRWRHLSGYLWAFLVLLVRTRGAKVQAPNGRIYLAAYYDHPEERAARRYADRFGITTRMVGVQ